jgi:hypothetical protein
MDVQSGLKKNERGDQKNEQNFRPFPRLFAQPFEQPHILLNLFFFVHHGRPPGFFLLLCPETARFIQDLPILLRLLTGLIA